MTMDVLPNPIAGTYGRLARATMTPALVSLLVPACALGMDWTPLGMRCDAVGGCLEGYSCLAGDTCIREHSVAIGGTCDDPVQCESGVRCAGGACRHQCPGPVYAPGGDCAAGEYCWPISASDQSLVAVCAPVEVCDDAACVAATTGGICVPLEGDAKVCKASCTLSLTTGLQDSCPNELGASEACQLVGASGSEQLVCLNAGTRSTADGTQEACVIEIDGCMRGYACLRGTCHRYCLGTGECNPGETCTDHPLAQGSIRLCEAP